MLRPWTCGRCRTANPGHVMHCAACGWSPMTQPTVMDPAAFQARPSPRRRSGLGPLIATLVTGLAVVAFVLGFGVWWRYAHPEVEIAWMANGVGHLQNLTSEPLGDVTITYERPVPTDARGFITGSDVSTETASWDDPHPIPMGYEAMVNEANRPAKQRVTLAPGERQGFIMPQGLPPHFPPPVTVRDGDGRTLSVRQRFDAPGPY